MDPEKPDALPTPPPPEGTRRPVDPTWEEPPPDPVRQADGSSLYVTEGGTGLAGFFSLIPAFFTSFVGAAVLSAAHGHDTGATVFVVVLEIIGLSLTWAFLHGGIRRIEIDDTRITFESLLGTRRGLLIANLQGETIWRPRGYRTELRITTVDGHVAMVPQVYFSETTQAAIRDDLARRCLKATGRHIDGPQPDFTPLELNRMAWFYVIVPWAAVIGIPLAAWLKHHGHIH